MESIVKSDQSNLYLNEYVNFSESIYINMIKDYGINKTWEIILKWLKIYDINDFNINVVDFYDLGRLYEIGLAYVNKLSKKDTGKYYTPADVSKVMAKMLTENNNLDIIADVGCGSGNLIIEVLKNIKKDDPIHFKELFLNKKIYLYDMDSLAIKICIAKIDALFKIDSEQYINIIIGDFLSKKIVLPKNVNVISNPPYKVIKSDLFIKSWDNSLAFKNAKDLYIGFFDKIIKSCKSAVVVSPQSYLVGKKFDIFRNNLATNFSGEIYSFDNVPGSLFCGKKEGVFNTNTSNSVRASITCLRRDNNCGFRLTHLLRFKANQREKVVNVEFLKSKLGNKVQNLQMPLKSFKELEDFTYSILESDHIYINDFLEHDEKKINEKFCLYVSTSARYYTVVSSKKLDRNGYYEIYAKDLKSYRLIYSLLSSSYCYMWWRIMDGGILFNKSLLCRIPVSRNINLNQNLIKKINLMINLEDKYKCYKKNANKIQESIKIPPRNRNEINKILFGNINFILLHKNYEE